jgi:activator of HSP90 ATPase
MTPKKINSGETKASNWEESGTTWVDRDCSKLGKEKLVSMLVGMSSSSEEDDSSSVATIVSVKDVQGSARVVRNTKGKTFLFEFSFECQWVCPMKGHSEEEKGTPTGWLKIVDVTDHSEEDLQ